MSLVSICIQNIRVYENAQFIPDPNFNLIIGKNAGGKTTLLEAIHLLSTGRSYRTNKIEQLQRHNSQKLGVVGHIQIKDENEALLGFFHCHDVGRRATINGLVQTQVSQLAQYLPLQVISPDTHYEFLHNAKSRRGALDWCLFHVEQDFRRLWARYQRVLQQRNAGLKAKTQTKSRYVWDVELVEIGEIIHAKRQGLIVHLLPYYQQLCRELLGPDHEVDIKLESGWNDDISFAGSLVCDRIRDLARGFTHSGPQGADLQINLNSISSRTSASHGQYKLLVIALRLAQILYLLDSNGRQSCLLIDDLAAELDPIHRARLTNILANIPVQVFVTATELPSIDYQIWSSYKTFHVEHGKIIES